MQLTFCDAGAALATPPRPRKPKRTRRGVPLLVNDSPLARDAVMQAERETRQLLAALDRRAARMADVTTTDADELKAFLKAFPSLRKYPGLKGDDVLSRCRGCREWLLAAGTKRGRTDVPACVAVKVGADSLCVGCLGRLGAAG